jgi:hypothetical protein
MIMVKSNQPVLDFHLGIGTDNTGRHIIDVLSFSSIELEETHDYIQWLFPLQEPSRAVPTSPVLTISEVAVFLKDPIARASIESSLRCMLSFYGLEEVVERNKELRIIHAQTFAARKRVWLTRHNHNFLRITRILKSLCLLGFEPKAQSFFVCLQEIYKGENEIVGATTFSFWKKSIR